MESVYIETSVVSYLVARPPARTVAHQWHVWTKDWWRLRRPFFECVISAEVLREAAAGDPKANRQRLEALSTLTVLRRTRAVDELTEAFRSAGALPAKAKADATHLAVATSHRVDYLLTWNMKHLANALILRRLRPVAEQHGHSLPVVCTPLQLMGEIEYEG
ncbi:MAG TPA: type II toxin-antitoxin system VapC family toxin [Candidatus Limnocylindrales bacterium]|nr:type II toxin-antitoxin system VapC family toxin [Candidatus Limnocylindrales bacterium]